MAFIDLDTEGSWTQPAADITIIGAGAAGILLAIKLSRQGKRVLILETGHFGEDEERQALNEVEQTGKTLNNAIWGRKRAVGGTTLAWGGQSLPFTDIDFEKREWVANSGWPIDLKILQPYYDEANTFMGIDNLNYGTDILPGIKLANPGINEAKFDYHVSKWSTQPDFYKRYGKELSEQVTVVYNANVTAIHSAGQRADMITVSNFAGKQFTVPVKDLVIAAGTIESVRLLLNNQLDASGQAGMGFMEHPCIDAGDIEAKDHYQLQRLFNTHVWRGHKYSIRLSLNHKYQREKQLLNCSASIMFSLPNEVFDPYGELKSFRKDFKLSRLLKISGSVPMLLKSAWAYYVGRFYYKARAAARLALMIEQEPCKESRITLSERRDRFGVPMATVNWQISYRTWETAVSTARELKAELENLFPVKVTLHKNLTDDAKDWERGLSDVCHHMGGSRMSSDPGNGVVDPNLKVWGRDNLYVCSCSVFPTSSHSNPTLTLLALTARLAGHLQKN